jgi:phosphatidylserine decarboxylase
MPRIAREGLLLSAIPGALAALLFLSGSIFAGVVGTIVTLSVVLFYRDPKRTVTPLKGQILCPADGRVVAVDVNSPLRSIEGGIRIGVFMNVLNVHINRIPVDGKVLAVRHIPGGFAMAHLEGAAVSNERTEVLIEDDEGRHYLLVQIAGLVARRIVCRLREGDEVKAGQRFGLICFGSRVDLYMPPGASVLVSVGDRVRAGLSVMAKTK